MAIGVLDKDGNPATINTLPSTGRASAANSLPSAASTEDKAVMDAQAASLVSILAKITADPATQTTLAAILAKIIAAPSTEAKQDTLNTLITTQNGYLDGVEGSLTSILAKIIAAPATEALQSDLNTLITNGLGVPAATAYAGSGDANAIQLLRAIADQSLSTTAAVIAGGTAADAAITANPITVGARVSAATPTAMSADGDVVNFWADSYGRQMVGNAPRARLGRAAIKITSSTTETSLISAGAAGVFRDVYRLTITNTSATATKVTIRDVTAGGTPEVYYLAAGETKGFSGPIDAADVQTTAASAWTAQCGTSVADVEICARYVERKA